MTIFNDFPVCFPDGRFNELYEPDGAFRQECMPFVKACENESAETIAFYAQQTNRLFSSELSMVASDGQSRLTHAFLPFFLSVGDFELLEKGLIQRAQVLNAALLDFYGERNLIKKGVIPAQVLFGHRNYLPALNGVIPDNKIFLKEYTVDVERAPDGRFWVVGEKTQMPLNIGLTVENRLLLSRVMPQIYAKSAPKRILPSMQSIARQLKNLAPDTAHPRIVLLVPSTQKSVGFENAFLARNLGISVLEPADLSVRGDTVYLKNMDGLKKVDVILRYIDDRLCDSLELDGSSGAGVAGLTQAVRAGNVKIVNPLGSGAAEIPALKAFIHGIARYFTGEDLILPSIAAWWCGQEKEADYVATHLNELRVCRALDGREVQITPEKLREFPERYVAFETVRASCTPVFYKDKILPAQARLRLHLIYDDGGYKMMAGGTAFSKIRKDTLIQDVWILNGKEKNRADIASVTAKNVRPVRSTFDLTSHTAENMFWLGRYLERSEDVCRLMRGILRRAVDSPELPEPNDEATLFQALCWLGYVPFADYANPQVQKDGLDAVLRLVCDKDEAFGLPVLFNQIKSTSDRLRDRLSADTWEIFSQLPDFLPKGACAPRVALKGLDTVVLHQNALSGLIRENMTREISWRFMEIGRRLERAVHVLDLINSIDLCAKNGFEAALGTILEVSDSRMTYRSRYLADPVLPLVFDLLICDETNPRAVVYQVLKLNQNICKIAAESSDSGLFGAQKDILAQLLADIQSMTVASGSDSLDGKIFEQVAALRQKTTEFSDTLTLSCFVHAGQTRQGPTYHQEERK